ncbi:HlyD family efflux transporter periplasmic adaptor subunit [Stenotrophomonas sp. MMGLT7]|uniref:efflux RND transporter periplasmic adaptor subunit n=1 Tax=Stenotrophomonas sp. MMGLT7 TaxID=2901227 RepID=UPI001E41ABE5|nr:HlyD family efflux transporter periplasmic adaptor subunit [Stenotrophomonas sp. MMGLT7]MCD7097479.1 HlyD family efflux transporter periplasmic adaptor subunit [Stenotrophomonas sp. MMGLT7]
MDIAKPSAVPFWKRRRVRWAIAAASLAVLAAIAAFGLGRAAPSVARNELWIERVQRGDMKREIRASGTLVPSDIRWIVAGATASVQRVAAQAGEQVQADTLVLELVNPELQANLQKAQASLAGAEADMAATRTSLASQLLDQQALRAQAQSELELARIKAQAYQRAHDGGAISGIDLRQSQIAERQNGERARIEGERVAAFGQNMAAQLRAAGARRDEAASALDIARRQVAALQVRAGIDGILQQVDVEPGQQVEAGAKLARVARPDALIARLQVPEVLAKDLALQLPVSVDTRNGVVPGHLVRVDPAVRDGSVVVDVAFDAALPAGARPDLSVDGRILLGTLKDVVSIGRPSLAAPDGSGTLFVLRSGEATARRVQVRYGGASSDRIEVRAGLAPGDEVVLSDTNRWNGYDRLRLR